MALKSSEGYNEIAWHVSELNDFMHFFEKLDRENHVAVDC
jgi:hypothetical protein